MSPCLQPNMSHLKTFLWLKDAGESVLWPLDTGYVAEGVPMSCRYRDEAEAAEKVAFISRPNHLLEYITDSFKVAKSFILESYR